MPGVFKLREGHYDAFRADKLRRFEDRAVRHLRDSLPEETKPHTDEQLRLRTRECGHRARSYELTPERQVIAFVDGTYPAGEQFHPGPGGDWARGVLNDPDLSA